MATFQPEREYLEFLSQGRFMIQRNRATGLFVFHPRVAEPVTGSTDLEWVEASGDGVVYATTVIRQRSPASDYNVVLIDLAEGVRMMSQVVGIPAGDVAIGARVKARVDMESQPPAVVFDLAGEQIDG